MNTIGKTLVVLAASASLIGCSTPSSTSTSPSGQVNKYELEAHFTYWQDVPEEAGGGKVLCVWAKYGYGAGTSCDWQGYHQKYDKPEAK